MEDDCNMTSGDHDYMKNLKEKTACIKDNKEQEPLEITTKSPEYPIQYPVGDTNVDNERVMLSYTSTKLRAEAPPFTPDCTVISMENPAHALSMVPINQEFEEHCFVNVNLVKEDLIESPNEQVLMPKVFHIFEDAKTNKNIALLDELPAQPLNPILAGVEIEMDARDVVSESSPSVAIREEIAPSQYPARSRLQLRRFTFGNRTKIAVLIASIVICFILIIYVIF